MKMLVVSETQTKPPATIETCDLEIQKAWIALRDDPKVDADSCRQTIDVWLDTRLLLMRKKKKRP